MALATPNVFGELLTNIIAAIIILLIGFVMGRLLGSVLHKLFSAMFAGKRIKGKKKSNNSSFALGLSSLISICIYVAAVIFALERLGITFLVFKIILAIAIIIIAGSILFLIVDFITNIYSGINILLSKKFENGDTLKIKKIEGTVKKVSLTHTKLITSQGDVFILSNKLFFKNKFSKEKKEQEKIQK